jgi:hypothetical protein
MLIHRSTTLVLSPCHNWSGATPTQIPGPINRVRSLPGYRPYSKARGETRRRCACRRRVKTDPVTLTSMTTEQPGTCPAALPNRAVSINQGGTARRRRCPASAPGSALGGPPGARRANSAERSDQSIRLARHAEPSGVQPCSKRDCPFPCAASTTCLRRHQRVVRSAPPSLDRSAQAQIQRRGEGRTEIRPATVSIITGRLIG